MFVLLDVLCGMKSKVEMKDGTGQIFCENALLIVYTLPPPASQPSHLSIYHLDVCNISMNELFLSPFERMKHEMYMWKRPTDL